jgi:hypothetical protein
MFSIEYGPKGRRVTVSGVRVLQIVAKAEALIASGATELRIIGPDGRSTDLPQFKFNLARMIIG